MTFKVCRKCKLSKPLDDFHNDKNRIGGKYIDCKICHRLYFRNRYKIQSVKNSKLAYYKKVSSSEEYKISAKLRSRKFYESINGRAKTLLNNAKKSTISKVFPCSVSLQHIIQGIEIGYCPVTGIKFQLDNNYLIENSKVKHPFSPSIDRIDSSKGYTDENTRIVIWQYNMAKGELSDSQILEIFKAVVRKNEPTHT